MRVSSVIEAVRIPIVFALIMWIIVFGLMAVIEAIWYIDGEWLAIAPLG